MIMIIIIYYYYVRREKIIRMNIFLEVSYTLMLG